VGERGSSGASELFYRFSAPEDGRYTFDTKASCDDDGGDGLTSIITHPVEEGDEIFVAVDFLIRIIRKL
jgi:hypothetical protein